MLNKKVRNPFPMIGKVFKYEFMSGMKTLLSIYGCMLVLAFIFGIICIDSVDAIIPDGVEKTIIVLFFVVLLSSFIITLVTMEKRFKRGLLEQEAYLNLTLPVTMTEHIIGRLLTYSVWFLMYSASIVVSFFLISVSVIKNEFSEHYDSFAEFTRKFYEEFNISITQVFVYVLLLGLSFMLLCIMFIMLVNAISHLVQKNRFFVEAGVLVVSLIIFFNLVRLILGYNSIDIPNNALVASTFSKDMWELSCLNFGLVILDVFAVQEILKYRLNLE